MKLYLDTSALVKLYVEEEGSSAVRQGVDQADLVVTSMLAYVEARAAFARRRHEGKFSLAEYRRMLLGFEADWEHYVILDVTDSLVRKAAHLAEAHRLRAYDAIHLASANIFRERLAEAVSFASWDTSLEAAAGREGFEILRARRK